MQNNLIRLSQVFDQVTVTRGRQGREPPLSGLLALTFLGLLAKISLTERQGAFAVFLSDLLQDTAITLKTFLIIPNDGVE